MTLQEELKIKSNKKFDEIWSEVKSDLEKAAENWETLSYEKNTAEDKLFNFVVANQEKYAKEGITVTHLEFPTEKVTLTWV